MPSAYYLESVELGKRFQKENSSWGGDDCKNYHNQILMYQVMMVIMVI
jgi:hypothetical protein